MSSKKTHQHTIPRCYLKYFSTENRVWVFDLKNTFDNHTRQKGISDKIFTRKEFYNFPNRSNEPVLENIFQKIESKDYHQIMQNVYSKTNLGPPTKILLLDWLLMMKLRSSYYRDNLNRLIHFAESTKYGLIEGRAAMKEKEPEFRNESKKISKAIQLSNFLSSGEYSKHRDECIKTFGPCEWAILRTSDENRFLTNGNPGYSITISEDIHRLNLSPYTPIYNLTRKRDEIAIHYFPLSLDYCLEISPIAALPNQEEYAKQIIEIAKQDIKIKTANKAFVEKINQGTVQTAYELLIGNTSTDIEPWINIDS